MFHMTTTTALNGGINMDLTLDPNLMTTGNAVVCTTETNVINFNENMFHYFHKWNYMPNLIIYPVIAFDKHPSNPVLHIM